MLLTAVLAVICALIVPLIHDSPAKQLTFAIIILADVAGAFLFLLAIASLVRCARKRAGALVARAQWPHSQRRPWIWTLGGGAILYLLISTAMIVLWATEGERQTTISTLLVPHWISFCGSAAFYWSVRLLPVEIREWGLVIGREFHDWTYYSDWSIAAEKLTLRLHWPQSESARTNEYCLDLPAESVPVVVALLRTKLRERQAASD